MFAVAFDLLVAGIVQRYPKGVSHAYADMDGTCLNFGLAPISGSIACGLQPLRQQFGNCLVLLSRCSHCHGLPASVRDIRTLPTNSPHTVRIGDNMKARQQC
jgi:virulence-associated protein VapD